MSTDVIAPSAGESVVEIEISSWTVADSDGVQKDQVIAMAETEKATLEIRSPITGKLKILSPAGSVVSPGTPVATVDESVAVSSPTPETTLPPSPQPTQEKPLTSPTPESSKSPTAPEPSAVTKSVLSNVSLPFYASPSVRKMIVENNVDISQLLSAQGGYQEGNSSITEKDVQAFLQSRETASTVPTTSIDSGDRRGRGISRETSSRKMTRLRQTIAKRLVTAQQTAALLTTFNEIDMGEVMAIRSHYKELFKKKHDIGLGFMSFFVKAVCQALVEFPIINSTLEDDMIVEHDYADVGIAVATPKGLVVPVIRNAESLNFKQIEEVIADYGRKGKDGSIPMDDLTGGTFTITNGGTFGSMLSTPIINHPQSAILGMHNIVERPVVKDGEIVIRPIMYVALTYDHRLIDGADSVRFLYRIKEFIEDPHRLLVGV